MNRIVARFYVCLISILTVLFIVYSNPVISSASESDNAVIVVDNYSLGDKVLEAGKDVEIVFTLRNVSVSASANSVVLTVSNSTGMLNPKYGSGNQIYIGNIGPGVSKNVSVLVAVNSKFKADYADISCKLDYVSNGMQRTNTVNIVIPASGGTALSVSGINVSARATVNGKSLVIVNYSNNSGVDISGARLQINGAVADESKELSLGIVEAGKNYSKDLYVVYDEIGSQQIGVKLVYPSDDEEVEIDLGTFTVNVTDVVTQSSDNNTFDPTIIWVGRAVAIIALLAAITILLLYMKKR